MNIGLRLEGAGRRLCLLTSVLSDNRIICGVPRVLSWLWLSSAPPKSPFAPYPPSNHRCPSLQPRKLTSATWITKELLWRNEKTAITHWYSCYRSHTGPLGELNNEYPSLIARDTMCLTLLRHNISVLHSKIICQEEI